MSGQLTDEQLNIKPGDSIPVRAAKVSLKAGRRLKKVDDPAMVRIITSPPTRRAAPRGRITTEAKVVLEPDATRGGAIREAILEYAKENGFAPGEEIKVVLLGDDEQDDPFFEDAERRFLK